MDAAISGATRLAFLVEDDGLASIHLDAPGQVIPRQPSEYWLLLGDAHDVEFVEDVDRAEVERRLVAAAHRERALHHASILLDGSWSGATRRRASAELNELLATPEIQAYVKGVLYSIPLPEGASAQSAQLHCVGTRVRNLLADLIRAQAGISEARDTWEKASHSVIESPQDRADARAQAVRSGLFPMMVAAQKGREELTSLKLHASESPFATLPAAEQLIAEWGAPLEEHWRRLGDVVETYWGYLTTLRSPQPLRQERKNLPTLSWPKRQGKEAVSDEPLDELHQKAIDHANHALDRAGKTMRRRRLVAQLLQAGTGLGAVTAVTGAGVAVTLLVAAMQFDVTRWLLVIIVSAVAASVFWLLDRVFKPSIGWVRTVREYEAMQSAREEFELEWARRLSPVARRTSSRPGAVAAINDAAAAFIQRLDVLGGAGPDEIPVRTRVGALRIVVDSLDSLADRTFSLAVADRSASYSGTSSVVLILPADQYVVRLSAVKAEGVSVHADLAAIVSGDLTTEVVARL